MAFQNIALERWPLSLHAKYDSFSEHLGPAMGRGSCTIGTRVDVLDEILKWAEDQGADSAQVFWIDGLAGTGKTTIAYTVCKMLRESGLLGASFFCSRKEQDTQEERFIIPTIVDQLSRRSSAFSRALQSVHSSSAEGSHRQMSDLLTTPWTNAYAERSLCMSSLVIVVDALDENRGGTSFLQELINVTHANHDHSGSCNFLRGLKFLVTSRPHPDIVEACRPVRKICRLHMLNAKDVHDNIRMYLEAELTMLRGHSIIDDLASRAGGLFIYVATAVRMVKSSPVTGLSRSEMLSRLSILSDPQFSPPGHLSTDEMYKIVIHEALSNLSEKEQSHRIEIIRAILTVQECSVDTIACLLNTDENTVSTTVSSLYAVLYMFGNRIQWYHASFPDSIFELSRFKYLFISEPDQPSTTVIKFYPHALQHYYLAHVCLRVMESQLHSVNTGKEVFPL
jgi:hypothetical protein